jgi:hypothetical protein
LPVVARGQQTEPVRRIGVLTGSGGLLVICLDLQCRHEETMSVDDYADEIEVPSFAPMVCSKCGGKVEVRPNWKEMPIMPPKVQLD